ncbi:hypothetical protein JL722_10836 [Aureococcus anophagefferens]|nr:hypothetical protein JL722_10836 [Aureococcus anophagefferens]
MEAAPEVGLTCYDSVDAAKALALPWPDLYYSPAWGAVELAAGASAWELALWRRRDDASDGAGPAFVARRAKRPVLQRGRRVGWDLRSPYGYSGRGPAGRDGERLGRHRNKVRKARKRGVAVAMSVAETPPTPLVRDLYEETMDRRSASRFYYFDEAYYAALVAEVPRGDCYYATATAADGRRVRGALPPPRRRAPLPPRVAAGYALAGPSAILDAAARLGAALGCATLHLGGPPARRRARDARAGYVVLDWTLGTSVLDPGAFDALMAIRAGAVHTTVDSRGPGLPAYRWPRRIRPRAVER